MNVGDAYWFQDHLTFVISGPHETTGEVVIVSVSRWEENRDQSCVLDSGDHPAISKESIVYYKLAMILSREAQNDFEKAASPRAPMSPELLKKVQEGTDSDYIPQKCQRMVEEWCRRQRSADRQAS